MRIHLKVQIKNRTNGDNTFYEINGLKQKNKLTYYYNKEKYSLEINSFDKLILTRETSELNSKLFFEKNKTTTSLYSIKDQNITLEINIKTISIELFDTMIKIVYNLIDTDEIYEYQIEMSE